MTKLIFHNLFTITCLAVAGSVSNLQTAFALTISLDSSPASGVYNYGITLSTEESIAVGDNLILSNISNDTDSDSITVSGSSFYNIISADFTSASLEAINTLSGSGSFSPAFTITTTGSLDSGNYLAFFTQNVTPSFSQGSLPLSNSAAVPFDFSPSLGFLVMGGMWGISHLRKRIARL